AQPPASAGNALTLVDLNGAARQTFVLANPPLGAAFGSDGMALVATAGEFLRLDPSNGRTELVDTIASAAAAANLPAAAGTPPVLAIGDADNLTVRDRLRLPENFTGRSVLNAAGDTLFGVSESGVMVIPVGSLNQVHRLAADREDLVFRGDFCRQSALTRTITIVDPGGRRTDFSVSTDLAGVSIAPSSGRTPAIVQVTVDPRAFQDRRGTISGVL